MSYEERKLGGEQIEQKLNSIFSAARRKIESITWHPELSLEFSLSPSHTLEIASESELYVIENIPREVLEDYPGKIGNETINLCISKLIFFQRINFAKVINGNQLL